MAWRRKSPKSERADEQVDVHDGDERRRETMTSGSQDPEPAKILERKVRLSRMMLVFEQIWPRVWMLLGIAGLFVILSLVGLWGYLGADAHKIVLGLFGLASSVVVLSFGFLKWPRREEALRRIERNSGVPHRPASSYEDQLTSDVGGEATTIWKAHKKRLADLLGKLRVGGPRPRVDQRDPFALRGLMMIAIAALLVMTGSNARDRLAAAFNIAGDDAQVVRARIDAWVTPPAYTDRAPIMLTDSSRSIGGDQHQAKIFEVPERSQFVVRVAGSAVSGYELVSLKGDGAREKIKSFASNEAGDLVEFRLPLNETMTLKLNRSAFEVYSWNFNVLPDDDPEIALVGKPSLSVRGSLKLEYEASDDYGVSSAEASFALAEGEAQGKSPTGLKKKPAAKKKSADPYAALFDEPLKYPLRLTKKNARKTNGKTFKDISSHPWAGLRVRMVLKARDQAQQVGRSDPIEFILPQRKFTKPMARAIIEQRRNLVKAPRAHQKVARALDALTIAPEKFIPDRQVYLGIRTVYWRLKNAPTPENVKSGFDQLWDIALRIEDGDLSGAERALRMAQERLQKALQENASQEELQKLMKELRQAMSQFLQALARKQAENGTQPQPQNGQGQNRMLTAQDLDRMMKNIEKMLQSGSKDAAQQMLSQLREMMEQMQTGNQSAGNQNSQQMMQSAQELGRLIGKQQKLLDDTFQSQRRSMDRGQQGQRGQRGQQEGGQIGQGRQGQRGRQGQQGRNGREGGNQPGQGSLTQRQNQLRGALGKLMEGLRGMGGQPPKELGGAGRAMENAERALGRGDLGQATRQQSLALDRLRKGTQNLVEQAMKGMARRMGRNGMDPLGRAQQTQGPDLGTSVKVPDEIDVQRAREILEELRRRLSDPSRPPIELDYIERLLKRF